MRSLIDDLAIISGRSQQEVVSVFHSCATIDPNDPEARPSVELTEVEEALKLPVGFFRDAIGRA